MPTQSMPATGDVDNIDKINLVDKHPDVMAEFKSGAFVIHKITTNGRHGN